MQVKTKYAVIKEKYAPCFDGWVEISRKVWNDKLWALLDKNHSEHECSGMEHIWRFKIVEVN